MPRRLNAAAALLLAWSPAMLAPAAAQAQAATDADARMTAAVDAVAAKALADKAVAGFAVAVVEDGRVRLARGYGMADLEHGVPATADTVFRIGSITKEFTAAAVLKLVEQGKLSLGDRLAKYLPAFPGAGEVTIEQLLAHTSGIRNYTSVPGFLPQSPREFTSDEMVSLIAGASPLYDFAPGTGWAYSNSGYYLLGQVIEKASGQPYAAFVKANLLDPVGLTRTRPDDMAEIVPARAAGYDKAPAAPGGFGNASHLSLSVAGPAGAMRSTVGELARWHEALLGGRVLKPATVARMIAPGRLTDGRLASAARAPAPGQPAGATSDYGLGISTSQRDGRRAIGHGGSINGFNAAVQTFPARRTTVVLLTNTGAGTAPLMNDLVAAIMPAPAASGRDPK